MTKYEFLIPGSDVLKATVIDQKFYEDDVLKKIGIVKFNLFFIILQIFWHDSCLLLAVSLRLHCCINFRSPENYENVCVNTYNTFFPVNFEKVLTVE
jgi:hypothetical protein